jgi:hypothetical protein
MNSKVEPMASGKSALHCSIRDVALKPLPASSGKFHKILHIAKDGTQILPVGSFNLLHQAHYSGGFNGPRGNLRC